MKRDDRLGTTHANRPLAAVAGALLFFAAGRAFPQSVIVNNSGKQSTIAIQHATIYPVTSAPIAEGTIVFSKGVITAVGSNVAVPADAVVIDGRGLSVYPGL